MNIIINNLGPIGNATFDFEKRISIFCGPNNTGKTYLSYLLYAFMRRRIFMLEEEMTDSQLKDFVINKRFVFPMDIDKIYRAMSERLENIAGDLSTIYGVSESMAKKMFPHFSIGIDMDKNAYGVYLLEREFHIELYFKGRKLARITKKKGDPFMIVDNLRNSIEDSDLGIIKEELMKQIFYRLIVSPVYDSHFFPAERNSLYTYYKDIMSNRNQLMDLLQRQENGNRQTIMDYMSTNSARYPLAVGQTLDAANRMSSIGQERAYYAQLADEIEEEILSGKLSLTEDGDMKFASNRAPRKEVPLYLSASMIKAVSGLVFCLRHVAGPNDMIFIDEPEVNCHPDVQILMTRIFGKMVNAGIRLVISTHSDYIIRELNNLIMLYGAKGNIDGLFKKWGYSKEMALKPEYVGAYLFTYGNKKTSKVKVSPIEVTDTGFEVSTIDESISHLNEVSEAIYYELKYGKKK